MSKVVELFKQFVKEDIYIMSIYENEDFYICHLNFNKYKGKGPSLPVVYYNKNTNEYKLVMRYEENSIVEDTKNSNLVYGEELFWNDDGLLDRDLDS